MANSKDLFQDLAEEDDFQHWYNEVFKGSSVEEETARIAWTAGRITGLRFGYAFTDDSILAELERLGAF